MTAQVIIDDIEESAIISVEIRPDGTEYPAVSFTLDEERDVVIVLLEEEGATFGSVRNIEIPAEAFWAATVALTRDNITKELEQLVNGND